MSELRCDTGDPGAMGGFFSERIVPAAPVNDCFIPFFFRTVSNSQQHMTASAESDCAATVFPQSKVTAAQRVSVPFIWGAELRCRSSPSGAVGYLLLSEIPLHVALRVPASAATSDDVVAELASRHIQLAVVLGFGAGGLIDTCFRVS